MWAKVNKSWQCYGVMLLGEKFTFLAHLGSFESISVNKRIIWVLELECETDCLKCKLPDSWDGFEVKLGTINEYKACWALFQELK